MRRGTYVRRGAKARANLAPRRAETIRERSPDRFSPETFPVHQAIERMRQIPHRREYLVVSGFRPDA